MTKADNNKKQIMKKRRCPVCDTMEAVIIMRFTPELISKVNPTYCLEDFRKAVQGKEEFLTYSKCNNCGMIYCENVWDEDTLTKVYRDTLDHVKSRDKILSIEKRLSLMRIWANILRLLKLSGKEKIENLKVIDFGCGWGDFLDVARGSGVSVMGYDEDTKKTILAKEHGHRIADNIDELKSFGPVDVVLMNSVLEHLQDVKQNLDLTKQLLKCDGLFVFGVMDYRANYIRKTITNLRRNLPPLPKNLNPVEHVNIYDYKSAVATLNKYDLEFISTGNVLRLTDFLGIRNSLKVIKIMNWVEGLSARLITNKEMAITIYAKNKK